MLSNTQSDEDNHGNDWLFMRKDGVGRVRFWIRRGDEARTPLSYATQNDSAEEDQDERQGILVEERIPRRGGGARLGGQKASPQVLLPT